MRVNLQEILNASICMVKATYNLDFLTFQLAEIAQGVWCCAVKVKSLINSVQSRTALACTMLNIFYPKEVLNGKRLKELDTRVVGAIAGTRKLMTFRFYRNFLKSDYSYSLYYKPCFLVWNSCLYKLETTVFFFFILDFAVVARISEKDRNETEDDGKSKEKKKITRGDVMQAMRQKCNQLIFQSRRPTYHKGEIF